MTESKAHCTLIGFELCLVAVCAFVAWYVQSEFTNNTLTIGLIVLLMAAACCLTVLWIAMLMLLFIVRANVK